MEHKKKIDLHLILKYGRPLICFVLVVSFIFIYGLNAFASGETFVKFYDVYPDYTQEIINSNPVLNYQSIKQNYINNGGDPTKLIGYTDTQICNGFFKYMGDSYITNIRNNIRNMNMYNTLVFSGATYDFRNAYTFLTLNNDSTFVNRGVRCFSNSPIFLVDGKLFSESSITLVYWNNNTFNGNETVVNINTPGTDGYYWYNLSGNTYIYNNISAIYFSDMNIYFSSSDGSSGFTANNFNPADIGSYFNFNFLKTGGYVVNGSDPVDEPEEETIGQYYTYCGIDAFFSSGNAESVLLNYTVSPNEYMRLHPSEYDVMIDISAVIVTSGTNHPNIPLTYSNSYVQGLETYINSASNPNLQIWFDDLLNVNSNNSLADALEGWWSAVTNADTQYYNPNGSVISFGGASASGGKRSLGGYSLNPNLKISDIVFQCSIRVEYNQTDPRQVSGVYRFQQGLISGSRTQLENTIATNFNVPESYNPQYPAPITDSQGNIVVGSGGTNLTVNPVAYNNLNAIVEYLYHIDAQEFLALAGNNQNAIQYALNTLSSTESNGFFPVLKRTFDIIPDQIWNWIKVSFAVILGGAILGISYRMVRWR